MSLYFQLRHMPFCNQKQYLCFMGCTAVFSVQNHLAQLLSPRYTLAVLMAGGGEAGGGEAGGGEAGGGEAASSTGCTLALTLLGMMDAASAVA